MSIDKNISKALDIDPIDVIEIDTITTNTAIVTADTQVTPTKPTQDEEDFELSRDTMRDLIKKGVHKLDEYGSIASDLENARAFEVYGNMLEKIAVLTEKLYDIHHKKKDLKDDGQHNGPINVDKAVFYGNQTDFLQHIKKKRNGDGQE